MFILSISIFSIALLLNIPLQSAGLCLDRPSCWTYIVQWQQYDCVVRFFQFRSHMLYAAISHSFPEALASQSIQWRLQAAAMMWCNVTMLPCTYHGCKQQNNNSERSQTNLSSCFYPNTGEKAILTQNKGQVSPDLNREYQTSPHFDIPTKLSSLKREKKAERIKDEQWQFLRFSCSINTALDKRSSAIQCTSTPTACINSSAKRIRR